MARTQRKKAEGPLAEVRARIRDAERQTAPIARESVGIDAEGYETLAVLIERGFGRKPDVLRTALSTGLKAMRNASEPQTELRPGPDFYGTVVMPEYDVSVAGTPSLGFGVPITTPPSLQRRIEAGEAVEEPTEEEDDEAERN